MADQIKYPHQAYMQKHHVRMADLPADIKEMIVIWNNDWQDITPKNRENASLTRASKSIQEEIEQWLDEESDDDSPAVATKKAPAQVVYKGKDLILHNLYQSGKTTITEAELKAAGYERDYFGLPKTQAHYCLKAVKGQKDTYQICKR